MGRPEPCVLFAQTFVHSHLDEYVDEVRFTEPVVISACELLEQNASASCPMISVSGASCPQSFALEVFVQCEGEARFRRLCQAFLYSPSSSNILEVQPVVTNHLVIRGSYRALTLVVYGNTAEELGQFSVEFDLDNSLASLVRSPAEGKVEDLPSALQPVKPTFEESISSVQRLHLIVEPQPSPEVKQIIRLGIKIGQICLEDGNVQMLTKALLLAASSYVSRDFSAVGGNHKHHGTGHYIDKTPQSVSMNLHEAKNELMDLYKKLCSKKDNYQSESIEQLELDDLVPPITEDLVLDIFRQWFEVDNHQVSSGISINSQVSKLIAGLSMVHLVCTDMEGCCLFVKAGGMQHLINILRHDLGTTGTTLLALGVVEYTCHYAAGCEAFLGWLRQKSECVPTGTSEGYSTLLRLLLERPQHNIACLLTSILHRLRAYEISIKFQSMVGSLLQKLSPNNKVPESGIKTLVEANSEMKRLLKLLNIKDPIEDPSPIVHAKKLLLVDQDDGMLPYKATVGLIGSSKYCFAKGDIDPYLLSLLKERCFLPLLAALLSSPSLRSGTGPTMDAFIDLVTTIEAILLALLLCRSGLLFLMSEPEATTALVLALRGVEDLNREEFLPLRYAAVLISKGFFCPPQDIGMIVETRLRVVSAIDRLIGADLHSEELLWALWDLCSISRSDIGRQAVLAVGLFPEAISVLMTVLQSGKDSESLNSNCGTSPLSLAIFHASAELFEVMVNDSTACTLSAWIPHAVDLHKALHSSSPGSNKKDAPTRLLERVDAAVVYHKKGAIGLVRYAAILASGGDAQLTSTSFLVSEPMEIDNIASDPAGSADFRSVESILGKLVSEKFFDGIILHDSSVPQLTTAMRILAYLAEQAGVAAAFYEEGAVTVIYVIVMNCALMLERSSNTYDYLVDEGAECNSTADLLLERSQEQSLVELLLPSLILLLTLLRKLQEAAEQHHNTKLLNALLRLHREISPKLAARMAVLPFCFASSTLALGSVCHLLVSCVACWPIFGWTPGLFQRLLENVPAPASLALGPKEACSALCLLGELFPEEGIWLWKNGTSSLNALKTLGVGTLLGVRCIEDIDWYIQPQHFEKMLSRLIPHMDKIGQIVFHFAFAALTVLQDMLRVLVIRISCQKLDSGTVLLRPLLSWIQEHICNGVSISEVDTFKGERLLEFVAGLLEHPLTKKILMNEGLVDILTRVLDKIIESSIAGEKSVMENRISAIDESSFQMQWCFPIFRSFSFIVDPGVTAYPTTVMSRCLTGCPAFEGLCKIISCILKFCLVAQVGKELRSCWDALLTLSSHNLGRSAFAFLAIQMQSSSILCQDTSKESENAVASTASEEPNPEATFPFLSCWQKLLAVMENDDGISHEVIEITRHFAICILHLCAAGKSSHGLVASRSLFGLECGSAEFQNNIKILKHVSRMIDLLNLKISGMGADVPIHTQATLEQTRAAVRAMLSLLEKSVSIIHLPEIESEKGLPSSELRVSSWDLPPHLSIKSEVILKCIGKGSAMSTEGIEESHKGIQRIDESFFLGHLADKFMWECPDSSPDRPTMPVTSLKRKAASVDGSNRRQRGDNIGSGGGAEATATSSFVRTGGAAVSSSGQTRRDTFRQRKPNTSRPPSMHVDDYVARERNNDGVSSSSNVATVTRAGSTGGRPPSIHVDEFMARQRERQQPVASTSGDLQQPVQTLPTDTESTGDKMTKSRQMKTHLEDDLHEINIELDVVSESDDMLQFSQSDDCLPSAPVSLPGANSPDSLADDSEFNTGNASHFIQDSKETPFNAAEGVIPASVTESEGGTLRHGSLTPEKGQGKQIMSGESAFHQEQFDNRMSNAIPLSSNGYETLATSKPPEAMLQFYDQRSILGMHTVADQGSMALSAVHHMSSQSQPGPGPMLNVSQAHFEQKALAHAPPLPPLPPPPSVPSGSTPQMVEASPNHASSYNAQPPLPSGSPFQAFDPATSGPVSSLPGRDQKTTPTDYYKDGGGSSMNVTTAPPLPPTGSRAPLEVSLHPHPPLQFHPEHSRATSYGAVSLATPPRPIFDPISGVSTSTTPWVGGPSSARISDENIASGRPPPPLPPMPPPFSAPPGLQPSSVQPVSGIYIQTIPTAPLPPVNSSTDKIFGSYPASSAGQSSGLQSHSLPPAFVPPLPPGRPMSLPGNLPSSVPSQQQGQNQQTHTHHIQQHLPSQPPQPPLQPRQPPQPPQPPRPPPPQPPQQPRPPLQPHQPLEQRPQTHTQASMQQPHIQFQPQPPPMQQNLPTQTVQQHPHLHQQQAQQTYYPHQQQEQLHKQQHEQGEHILPQYHHQQAEHVQQQQLQQQESSLSLQQYFSSPEAIQALLSDQEKLRRLLEQHPKLMQMLQERLSQL